MIFVNEKENGKDECASSTIQSTMTSADYYFDSYSHFGIHEEMLKDEVRTKSYMKAIELNRHLFRDKTVLDVGAGLGILSMFAARAGAKKVYAVECSNIADQCKLIIEANGYSGIIEVFKGKMEEITLPGEGVDIILSEWMGYFLLYESMLDTVLYARDKYLKPNGMIFPDKAVLYISAIEDGDYKKEKINFWENVYGFNMSVMKDIAYTEPLVDLVDSRAIVSNNQAILDIDILTCKKEDLNFSTKFSLTFSRDDYCHAFVAYFECSFTQIHKPIKFSTGPNAQPTHWKQTVFYLNDELVVNKGETIEGTINCVQNTKNCRDLDITIDYAFDGENNAANNVQMYKLR